MHLNAFSNTLKNVASKWLNTMHRDDVKKLKDLGVDIVSVTYSFPDEELLKSLGFWNIEHFPDEIDFTVIGKFKNARAALQLQKDLLSLAQARRSNNAAVKELLDQLETLLRLTE